MDAMCFNPAEVLSFPLGHTRRVPLPEPQFCLYFRSGADKFEAPGLSFHKQFIFPDQPQRQCCGILLPPSQSVAACL
jgi:hypothetical protein